MIEGVDGLIGTREGDAEDARLVERFQAGDMDAFGTLYERWYERLYSYLRVILKRTHDAEDATQQVFTQALEALPRYESRSPFRAWLFAIARNHAIAQLRKENQVELVDPAELDRLREQQGVAELELPELVWITDRDLTIFVELLPMPQRQVLVLRYLLDLPNKEVAEVLGRTPDQVKVLHYRAMTFLRERLAAIGRGPDGEEKPEVKREPEDEVSSSQRFKQNEVLRHRRFVLWK